MKKNPSTPSFDRLIDYRILLNAWKIVSSKGSAGGVDGIPIIIRTDYGKFLKKHLVIYFKILTFAKSFERMRQNLH